MRIGLLISGLLFACGVAACQQPAASPPPPPPLSSDAAAALRAELVPPSATLADLATLDQAYRALHPGLFRHTTPAAWTSRVDSLRHWLGEPRPRGELFLAFSRLVASIRCGHSYLNYWNQPAAMHRWLTDAADKLPFEYALASDDRWVVTRADSVAAPGLHPGDTVTAVQGQPTPAVIAQFLAYVRADGSNDGKRRALLDFRHEKKYEAIDVLLPLLLPPTEGRYTLTVRRPGTTADTTLLVAAMPAAERRARAQPRPAPRAPYEVTMRGPVATLRVDAFDYGPGSEAWAPFVKRTFRLLKARQVTHLILDLRANEGGSDEGAELLLRHLIRTPITVPPLRRYVVYQTVPAALRAALTTWDDSFYDRRGSTVPRGDGTFDLRDRGSWPASIPVAKDAFSGEILLLTSYVNSSASHLFLRLLQRRPGITLIGDPTGGSQRAHTGGNLFFLRLPGTGMEVDVPLIAYDWGADQPEGGVEPDVRVPAASALHAAEQLTGVRP